jgi:6-phosphogluconolactonase
MGKVDLVRFESAKALAKAAANEWLRSLSSTASHYVAFSGGRIAEKFFDAITSEARHHKIALANVHFFWADERCVPPDHPESNYQLMHRRLLQPLEIPARQVHRIKGELGPTTAARQASQEFARVVPSVLDLVVLGMGEDGHIASIFPDAVIDESLDETYRPVFSAPKPPPERVTLTLHAIAAARSVWALASGPGKAEALGESLNSPAKTPLAHLLERREITRILTDIPGN